MQKSQTSYIYKSLSIGLLIGLLGFTANANDDVFEEPPTNARHTVRRVDPPLFQNSSEKIDFLTIATPLYLGLGYEFAQTFQNLSSPYFCGGLVGGYLMADLVSGVGHMVTDSLNPEIFPESLAAVFREAQEHHAKPLDVYDTSIWANNKKYHLVGYCVLGAATLSRLYGYDLTSEVLCGVTALNMWTGLAHLVGHGGYKDYWIVKKLQTLGLLITPKAHRGHHSGKFDRNFCVISGLMNAPLNMLCDATRATRRYLGFSS